MGGATEDRASTRRRQGGWRIPSIVRKLRTMNPGTGHLSERGRGVDPLARNEPPNPMEIENGPDGLSADVRQRNVLCSLHYLVRGFLIRNPEKI